MSCIVNGLEAFEGFLIWLVYVCRGKRSGVFGAFLLAVYNPEGEEFQTISKIGTGFSEEQLKQFSEELRQHTIPSAKPYYRCAHGLTPCGAAYLVMLATAIFGILSATKNCLVKVACAHIFLQSCNGFALLQVQCSGWSSRDAPIHHLAMRNVFVRMMSPDHFI